jgi:hypothetical protein
LKVPDNILDEELLQNSMWPRHPSTGQPVREAFEFLEYIKDNYWNGESMVEHIIRAVLPIFQYAFPGCHGWAFDNATNHNIYATDALIASRMHLDPGGQTQPQMREGFDHTRGLPHPMVFLDNHPDFSLRGKPKGLEAVLRERGYGLQVDEGQIVSSFWLNTQKITIILATSMILMHSLS